MPINQNTALFSLLGTIYGGDGRTSFALPDLRGRTIRHAGSGPGLNSVLIGQRGGAETVTLSISNMPSHNHTLQAADSGVNFTDRAGGNSLASQSRGGVDVPMIYEDQDGDLAMRGTSITSVGGGQAFSNLNPFLVMNVCLCLVGLYPSRN